MMRFQTISRPSVMAGGLGVFLCGVILASAQDAPPPPQATSAGGQVIIGAGRNSPGNSFLGVNIWEVNAKVAKKKGLSEEHGVIITGVVEESAAEKAGLRKGDVVLEYNGQRVEGVSQFIRLVRETPVGRKVELLIYRDGAEQTVSAVMGEKKGKWTGLRSGENVLRIPGVRVPNIVVPDVPHIYTTWRSTRLGIVGESLESQLAEYFGVTEGVLVRSVSEDTPASRAGLKAGDVIVEVDGTAVATPREITDALRDKAGTTVPIVVMRNREKMNVNVTLEDPAGGGGKLERMIYFSEPSNL